MSDDELLKQTFTSQATSQHLKNLSVNTSTTTEKRILPKKEQEERRAIQKQMMKKIRELTR